VKRNHLRVAPVVALLALLISAAPVAAETVPEGVLADAAVTVTVKAADAPVAGALVVLEVLAGTDVLFTWNESAGDDGVAAFAGVWRPDAGGPALEWRATASWTESKYGADAGVPVNCRISSSLDGNATTAAAAGPADIAVAAEPASSILCGPPLEGSVVDENLDPFDVAEAYVSGTDGKGHVWQIPFEVDGTGAFTALAPPVEEVSFFIRGAASRTEIEGGCTYTSTLIASKAMVPDPETHVVLVAEEERILGSCTATPAPVSAPSAVPEPTQGGGAVPLATPPFTGGGGPALTPPNTDVTPATATGAAPIEIVLGIVAAASVLILLLVPRRGRAREVRQTQ
jgi:hypothetical protein